MATATKPRSNVRTLKVCVRPHVHAVLCEQSAHDYMNRDSAALAGAIVRNWTEHVIEYRQQFAKLMANTTDVPSDLEREIIELEKLIQLGGDINGTLYVESLRVGDVIDRKFALGRLLRDKRREAAT
jgi:hypothetical protein